MNRSTLSHPNSRGDATSSNETAAARLLAEIREAQQGLLSSRTPAAPAGSSLPGSPQSGSSQSGSALCGISLPGSSSGGTLPAGAVAGGPELGGAIENREVKLLIIDDEPINIKVIQKYLQQLGYQKFVTLTQPLLAMQTIEQERPDLVLLDVMMPDLSGLDILRQIRQHPTLSQMPVIILTASCDREMKLKVLDYGATDFLAKPIDPSELAPRVKNVLMVKRCQDQMANYALRLEAEVQARTAELESSRQDIIHCLARAAEFRDDDTGHHIIRVGRYAAIIARAMGYPEQDLQLLEQAAKLHDMGKIGIPDGILLKPGKLEPEEFERMQKHAGFGKRIIERMPDSDWDVFKQHVHIGSKILEISRSPVLQMAATIALTHHEWWDGNGYPLGLAGEDIPLEGRITAVADVFDALSTKRSYKPPFPIDRCFQIIQDESGTHFDPRVVEAFMSRRSEILEVQLRYADTL